MKNWIWFHPHPDEGTKVWQRQLAQMRRAGVDAVLVLVADGARALYQSRHLPVVAPVLEQLLPLAAAEGIEVHAWMVCLQCNVPSILHEHADWYSVSRDGHSSRDRPPYVGDYQWLCPTREPVRRFVCAIVDELGAYEGLTGIHLDYIRRPDVILPAALQPRYGLVQDRELPEYDFCYCDACRSAFRERTGRDPLLLPDPAVDAEWVAFRCDSLRDTVSLAAAAARTRGKEITAAVFATPELARRYVRQEWQGWDLDAVMPMIYHHYYSRPASWVQEAVRQGVAALPAGRPLYAGLYVAELDPAGLGEVMRQCARAGAAGVALFSGAGMTEAHYAAARGVLA
ncbi:MAG: hypothetical protein WDA75_01430 [Candidatus Latescibacterota bacterium]|jgi:uncharacterized lipoprotein YddW (UPF0748 family)